MIVPHGCKAAVCESFVPCGKISNGKHYSIITDHLGTPIEAYNQEGELIWEREQDLYGNSRQGFAKENFRCPFKYQGQYYDPEIELCYNRFRYYHPETGRYISQDPIKLLGGFNVFAYVSDTNWWLDVLGLDGMPKGGWNYHNMPKIEDYQLHHVIPKSMEEHPAIKAAGFDVHKPSNLIYLPTEEGIHPTRSIHKGWNKGHKEYNDYIKEQLEDIWDKGKDGKWTQQQFRDAIEELRRETRLELRNGSRKCYSIH